MTAPIMQAISSGFSSQQVLSYLMRKFPQHAKKISHALAMGYTPSQVLSYLSGGKKAVNSDEVGQTEHETTMKSDKRRRNTNEALVAGTAAAAAGGLGYGLSRLAAPAASNAIRGQLLPAVPGIPRPGSPTLQLGHTPMSIPPNPTPTNPNPSPGPGPNTMVPPSGNALTTHNPPPTMPQTGGMTPQTPTPIPSNAASSQSPIQNVANNINQGVDNQQVRENNLEPLTQQDKAYQNILDRQKESARLFDLAKEKRPGKEGTTPFMRMARELIKRGQIKSASDMDEFRKYWQRTEGNKRRSPLVEFEIYRSQQPQYADPPEMVRMGNKPTINAENLQNNNDLREKISQTPKVAREPTDLDLKTEAVKFGVEEPISHAQKIAKTVTYEKPYKDLSPEQAKNFKIIDNAINKTADFIISGKDFTELLESRKGELWSEENKKGITLSTAEDVLRHLAGMESKYNLLTPEEQEDAFETFTGLTPNLIWNTISLIDPNIQRISRPISPKGKKEGKKEMTPNDFRRFLGHAVFKTLSILEQHGDRAKMIVSAVDAVDSLRNRKMEKATREIQEMDDETIFAMLAAIDEEEIKKYR